VQDFAIRPRPPMRYSAFMSDSTQRTSLRPSAFWIGALSLGLVAGWGQPAFLVWAAWLAPCAGWHTGAQAGPRRALAPLVVAFGILAALGAIAMYGALGALGAWGALASLACLPFGLARRFCSTGSGSPGAGALAVLGLILVIAPSGAGLLEGGWAKRSPRLAGLAMDASPMVFVIESAGLDVLRMPLFYESDTTDFVMGTRRPWETPLAPMVLLVVGWASTLLPSRSRTPRS
jgi:hypothetical protein